MLYELFYVLLHYNKSLKGDRHRLKYLSHIRQLMSETLLQDIPGWGNSDQKGRGIVMGSGFTSCIPAPTTEALCHTQSSQDPIAAGEFACATQEM